MWWPKALLAVLLLTGGPVGCGFRPMYATGNAAGPASTDLARIRIDPIADRLGQQVRNALLERLSPQGESGDPLYVLKVILTESVADLGYRKDNYSTLGNMTLTATVTLYRGDAVLLNDSVSTVVSFNYLGPRYASVVMERDARDRAAIQLADDIRGRLAAAIARYKANPGDPRYRPRGDGVYPLAPPVTP